MKTQTTAERMTLNISKPTNTDDLRTLYAEVKAGAALPHALVRAALDGLTDKACRAKARTAFGALGLSFDLRTHCAPVMDVRAAATRGDYRAIVCLVSGSHSDLWAAAMTAHYGPTWLHPSRCNADDTPTAETLATCPGVAECMQEARERVASALRWYERDMA